MANLKYTLCLAIKEKSDFVWVQTMPKSVSFPVDNPNDQRSPSQNFNCREHSVELYNCKLCDFKVDTIVHLRSHMEQKHLAEKNIKDYVLNKYFCRICSFQTHSALQWLKHDRSKCLEAKTETFKIIVAEPKNKQVTKSNYVNFFKSEEYRLRKRSTRTRRPEEPTGIGEKQVLQCKHCMYHTTWPANLKAHTLARHSSENDKKFKCSICEYKSTQKRDVKVHFAAKHSDKEEWFKCGECSYRSPRKCSLKVHFHIKHLGGNEKRRFLCDKCTYETNYRSHLNRHYIIQHTERDVFKCDQCEFQTRYKRYLAQHKMAKHTEDDDGKWFKCGKCPYRSTQRACVDTHFEAKHCDKNKWFQCEKCTFKSKWQDTFAKHLLKHDYE